MSAEDFAAANSNEGIYPDIVFVQFSNEGRVAYDANSNIISCDIADEEIQTDPNFQELGVVYGENDIITGYFRNGTSMPQAALEHFGLFTLTAVEDNQIAPPTILDLLRKRPV